MEFKTVIFWFVTVSFVISIVSMIYLLVDVLVERRADSKRSSLKSGQRDKSKALTGALFGIGALSLLGNLLVIRRINKMSDTFEERRKWK